MPWIDRYQMPEEETKLSLGGDSYITVRRPGDHEFYRAFGSADQFNLLPLNAVRSRDEACARALLAFRERIAAVLARVDEEIAAAAQEAC